MSMTDAAGIVSNSTRSDDVVLIAGAGGFIGGHLGRFFLEHSPAQVRLVDIKPVEAWYQYFADSPRASTATLDLRDARACETAVEGATHVLNLAADMGGMGFIEAHKAECMLSVLINTHLLLAARRFGVRRFFFASSACVYNSVLQAVPSVAPLAEEDAYPAAPEDGYGWEKLFSERMCRHFREDFGLETRVARYHNVYGPCGTWEGGREKAPAAVCRKVALAVLKGEEEIDIWGDGEQTRSFTFIDDCVEGTIRLMYSSFPDPMNVGSNEMVSINQLVDVVERIAGVRLARAYQLVAPLGVRGRNSDNTRIRHVLNWEPSIKLAEGMPQLYSWILGELKGGRRDPLATPRSADDVGPSATDPEDVAGPELNHA